MASTKKWFETIAEAERRAKRRLPKSVYSALVAGSELGVTARDNVDAFSELGFRPRVADLPRRREQPTGVLGQAGVTNVLSILRSGIDEALLGLGRSPVHELVRDDLIIPTTFVEGHLATLS